MFQLLLANNLSQAHVTRDTFYAKNVIRRLSRSISNHVGVIHS